MSNGTYRKTGHGHTNSRRFTTNRRSLQPSKPCVRKQPPRSLHKCTNLMWNGLADCVVWAVDQGAQVLHLSLLAIRTVPLWKLKAGMIPRCHSTSSRWASGRVSRPPAPHARPAALRRGPARCDRTGRACPCGVPSSCRDTASGWCCDGDLFTVRGATVRFDAPPARSRAGRRSSHALSGKISAAGENGRGSTRTFLEH
jgi:hypothetical protein